ncbi:hypothetical protein Htur_0759 [Haloterrigena turkmenica DSM 5511]|uniref:Uncharacterized protein n=1 Tax=Haloterrigena turkmenica (strain ATCC 51198 / DSM 5511 / JCM 9101 / NCIMB 13204 / VKM B-1734 / 4k) TaxID=543526 RepID=D2RX43_HALTV|nr:hypothetical protein [Haloterrigena turkmenica]ADB59655.1 hypothetical protein Htur_0759 [Haloterrigena turkmenica DSM 5511]
MLVHLRQYKHEEVQFDDNRTTGESQTEDTVNPDAEDYFGKDMDEFDVETWDTVEYEGDPIERRSVTIEGVTAVSVPQEPTDEDDPDLPGRTLQLRMGGGIEFMEQAEIVEVQDMEVTESEAEGKVSKEDDPQGKAPMDEEP